MHGAAGKQEAAGKQASRQAGRQIDTVEQPRTRNGLEKEKEGGDGEEESLEGKLAEEETVVVVVLDKVDEEQAGVGIVNMLQTVPRVPVAGVRRRWGGSGRQHTTTGAAYHHHNHHHHHHHLQESCPEVSSSGVLSPLPTSYRSGTPETNVVVSTPVKSNENLQLWDLDLQRGLQQAQIHQQKQQKQQQQTNTTTITTTTIDQYNKTSTVVPPNVTTTSNIIATTNDHHPGSPYQSTSEGIVTSTTTTQLILTLI
ncbi:hypothetical protein M0804_006997 [Polistes exclamans]|nr:hypothetical protein M0804_006997 [Polistes exclamans]